jgi:hypothetical protein
MHEQSRKSVPQAHDWPKRCELSIRRSLHAAYEAWLHRTENEGSHIIFQRGPSFLNLQPSSGGKAKAYQVRQMRQELQKLNLKP